MSLTHIQTITAGTPGISTIDFTNIPQNFTDLQVVLTMRSNRSAGVEACKLQFNGSTTGYVDRCLLGFSNNTGYSETNTNLQYGMFYFGNGDTTISGAYSSASIYIPNYTASTNKRVSVDGAFEDNAASAWQGIAAITWSNSQAINRLTVSPLFGTTWLNQTTASLYGVDKTTPTGSGATPNVEYLVVAGGGGGGYQQGGGGGAGGYRTSVGQSGGGSAAESALSVTAGTPITVTVGGGGVGSNSSTAGGSGSNTSFGSIVSIGGGRGGTTVPAGNRAGLTGGSGGGIGPLNIGDNFAAVAGTANQGYPGGAANATTDYTTGTGGGGAGSAGVSLTSGTYYLAGAGGQGVTSTITGTAIARAGGGGGGAYNNNGAGVGGAAVAGGGAGTNNASAGGDGQMATGGGGGGGGQVDTFGAGGRGGSGIVIIRYPDIYADPTTVTGNPVVNYANGYKIYTWTVSGSITF